ncbi:hypothetical protein BGZ58_008647 [Dissophora ornata]|nr:hypothetical protein BGZ58_008647 [Dissophora ornata]
MIGHRLLTRAQRKDIKKVHVPKGIVMQYEGELVSFLDQLTLSSDDEEDSENSQDGESDSSLDDCRSESENSTWVFVQALDNEDAEPELSSTASKTLDENDLGMPQEQAVERPQIYLRWDIQDQFLRFVAHALCSFYGLISFSKTAKDGKRLVYICHPAHLDSIGQLTTVPAMPALSEPAKMAPTRPKLPKRQSTLEQVQELPLHELDQLWNKVEPVKVTNCVRPDMTFFEYLYPSTRPMF